jgi:hypothetical protein
LVGFKAGQNVIFQSHIRATLADTLSRPISRRWDRFADRGTFFSPNRPWIGPPACKQNWGATIQPASTAIYGGRCGLPPDLLSPSSPPAPATAAAKFRRRRAPSASEAADRPVRRREDVQAQSGAGAARLAARRAPAAPEATTTRRGRGAPTPRGCGAHTATRSMASPCFRLSASGRLGPTAVAARRHRRRRRPPAPATMWARRSPLPPLRRLPLACGWRWTRPPRRR